MIRHTKTLRKYSSSTIIIILVLLLIIIFLLSYIFFNESTIFVETPWGFIASLLGSAFGAAFLSLFFYERDRNQVHHKIFELLENNSVFRRLTTKEKEDCNFLIGKWTQYKFTQEYGLEKPKISNDVFEKTSYDQISINIANFKIGDKELKNERHQGYIKRRYFEFIEYETFAYGENASIAGDYIRTVLYIANKNYDFTIGKSESINYDGEPYTTMILLVKSETNLDKKLVKIRALPLKFYEKL